MSGIQLISGKSHMRSAEFDIEEESERELSRSQLLVLVCTLCGLQVVWSILNGNINVFLLSIGIPTSISPLIWLIAPLCGTIEQPVVGWLSDQNQSRYGRRKPFMLGGTLATITSLIGLSWSQDLARVLSRSDPSTSTLLITVMWVVLLNLSIQPLQMAARSLVMDGCPKAQQPQANAWAGCAVSIGSVLGYFFSFATASTSTHLFGFSHFKYLAIIASVSLIATTILNLWLSTEKSPEQEISGQSRISFWSLWQHFYHSNLVSSRTRIINKVQFCAWMGWFPFLFYMTAFVSHLSPESDRVAVGKSKSQPGALAGFLYALVFCIGSLSIPQLLRRTKYASAEIKASIASPIATLFGFSLEQVWCAGQTFFGILMFSTIFASNSAGGIVIVAFAGVPWALTNYVPFALLGVEVAEQRSLQQSSVALDDAADSDSDRDGLGNENEQVVFGTGATIGLHNAAISAPQILAAVVSAAVLALSEKLGVQDGFGWVMRLSGVAALAAAWQIKRLFV